MARVVRGQGMCGMSRVAGNPWVADNMHNTQGCRKEYICTEFSAEIFYEKDFSSIYTMVAPSINFVGTMVVPTLTSEGVSRPGVLR